MTLDLDLSSPDHIRKLLTKIKETRVRIVVASPYAKEGTVSNVPLDEADFKHLRDRLLAGTTRGNLSTLTSMVRAYDGKFLKSLNLRSLGMEINPEVIYKAKLLNARVDEIPAKLDRGLQKAEGVKRRSSMNVLRHKIAILLCGFLFRPVMFFGLALLVFSIYVNT